MPRRARTMAAIPAAPEEVKRDKLHTLVISNIPQGIYNSLLLKTFKDAAQGKGRPSVSQAIREILEDWNRREGPAMMINQ